MTFLFKYRIPVICFFIMVIMRFEFEYRGPYKLAVAVALVIAAGIELVCLRRSKGFAVGIMISTVLVFSALSFIYSYLYSDIHIGKYDSLVGQTSTIEAVCKKADFVSNYSCTYEIKITCIDDESVNIGAMLVSDYDPGIEVGDIVTAEVIFLDSAENEYFDGEHESRLGNGLILYASAERGDSEDGGSSFSIEKTGRTGFDIEIAMAEFNSSLDGILKEILEPDSAELVSALLLGNRDGLDSALKLNFRRLGISHLLAVSGLHLSILTASMAALMKQFGIRRGVRDITVFAAAIFFMGVTGFSASVMRAAIMFALMTLLRFMRIKITVLNALFLTVTGIILLTPYAVYDVSLILSFLATFGIVIMLPGFKRLIGKISFGKGEKAKTARTLFSSVVIGLCTGISSMIFTLPVMWSNFGEISLISPITTVIFTPFVWLIIVLGCLTVVLSPIRAFFPLVSVPAGIADIICTVMRKIAGEVSEYRGITVSLKYNFTLPILLCFAAVVVVLMILKVKSPFNVLLPFTAAVVAFAVSVGVYDHMSSEYVHTEYLNIGKNDGFLVIADSKTLICDISDGSAAVFREAAEMSKEKYCRTEIDAYMLTHYHQRHISNFEKFCSSNIIRLLILPQPITDKEEEISSIIAETARKHGCDTVFFDRESETVEFGDVEISVPVYGYIKRSTHPVISLCFDVDNNETVYVGSSVFDFESELSSYSIYEAENIIFGAHGPILKNITELGEYSDNIVFANETIEAFYNIEGKKIYGNQEINIKINR